MKSPNIRRVMLIMLISLFLLLSLILGFNKSDSGQPCLDCHTSKMPEAVPLSLNEKYLHPPVQKNQCPLCHEPSRKKEEIDHESLCYKCHEARKFEGKPFRHPSLERGPYCLFCHKAHSSNFKFLLKGDPIAFCQSCHPHTKKYRSHPVGDHVKDPLRGRRMTCTSTCHDVHRSDFRVLIPCENRELCLRCHPEVLR